MTTVNARTNQDFQPPEPAASDTVTHEHQSSESSKTSSDSYDSPLQAPSPVQGNAIITIWDA